MQTALDERLEQARAARETLTTLQEQSDSVEVLWQEVVDRDTLARARSVAKSTEEQGRAAVEDVRPQLHAWRVSFRDWTRQGWRLLAELRTLESRLVPALDVAVAGATSLAKVQNIRPGDFDERVFLGQSDQDQSVDRVLERLGVADLGPFDDVPDGFPQELANLCLRHVGRVFVPRLGRIQFQRRGAVRR